MDLDLTPDQKLFRSTTAKFLLSETPLEKVRELSTAAWGFEREWWTRGVELGWAAMLVPEELGGGNISGEGLLDLLVIAEEMGRLVAPGPLVTTNVVLTALAESVDGPDHTAELEAVMSGESVAAWAVYEPQAAWGRDTFTTTLTPDGDGYLLTGLKDRVEADRADVLLVTAQSEGGPTQVLVPLDADGVTVQPASSLDVVRRFAEVRLDAVWVPASAVVGRVGGAAEVLERQRQVAAVLACAETCGAVDRVLEFTVEWAFDRYSFGRPLASYQALKHRFADMKTWLEASFATTLGAARAVQHRTADAAELVSVAKSYVGSRSTDIIQDCVQMHGGLGVTWEHDLHLYLRRATVNRALYGTPAEHRRRIADLMEA
jgi:alkylation response protein AidB-like acyl-CoA dehydrogenase